MPPERPGPNPEAYSVFSMREMQVTARCALRWNRAATILRARGIANIRVEFDPEQLNNPEGQVSIQLHFNSQKSLEAWNRICGALASSRKKLTLLEQEKMEELTRGERMGVFKGHLKSALHEIRHSLPHIGKGNDFE